MLLMNNLKMKICLLLIGLVVNQTFALQEAFDKGMENSYG
jgi:hypothetical protein